MLMLVGIASAACPTAKTILKISGDSNAHGELYNGTNYATDICFDDFFISPAGVIGAPHNPNGGVVLNLSSATNAHGEGSISGNYKTGVTYSDFLCEVRNNSRGL